MATIHTASGNSGVVDTVTLWFTNTTRSSETVTVQINSVAIMVFAISRSATFGPVTFAVQESMVVEAFTAGGAAVNAMGSVKRFTTP